jgi:hypothetical protein
MEELKQNTSLLSITSYAMVSSQSLYQEQSLACGA